MAKDEITLKITGREDIFADLRALENDIDEVVGRAFEAQEQVFMEGIKANWVSLAGGSVGDFVYDSISMTVNSGANGSSHFGKVGVFNMDSVASSHSKLEPNPRTGKKPMNAAQIAYWTEFGTSRLRSGIRKKKGTTYSEEDLISVAPKPFVSTAFYSTLTEQENAFVKIFNENLNRITK